MIRDFPRKRNKKVHILAMDPFHGHEDEVTVNQLEAPESLDTDILTRSLLGVCTLHGFPAAGPCAQWGTGESLGRYRRETCCGNQKGPGGTTQLYVGAWQLCRGVAHSWRVSFPPPLFSQDIGSYSNTNNWDRQVGALSLNIPNILWEEQVNNKHITGRTLAPSHLREYNSW